MRALRLFPAVGVAGLGLSLLVACGGNTGGSGLVPVAAQTAESGNAPGIGTGSPVGVAPTPVVLPSPVGVPTSVPPSPVSGLPSPAPT